MGKAKGNLAVGQSGGPTVAINSSLCGVIQEALAHDKVGEIFGMVGPNGAGKTSTIECVEGLREPDEGSVQVLGLDPHRSGYELRERIGVQLQETALAGRIKVREAMELFTSFYRRSVDWAPLLDQLGLADKHDASFGKLSGGQKQRLFIALALALRGPLGHVGINLAITGASAAQMTLLWLLLRRRLQDVRFAEITRSAARTLLATLPAAALAIATTRSLAHLLSAGAIQRIIPGVAGVAVFALTFIALAWLTRSAELGTILSALRRRA